MNLDSLSGGFIKHETGKGEKNAVQHPAATRQGRVQRIPISITDVAWLVFAKIHPHKTYCAVLG
ncbi:MAG TPA: hypothetical protein VF427_05375 [Noviherbaspirillum sp.]